MVLDAKVMEWATQHGLDTAALKKAKIPVYGKWYFPDLPANTPLVNMRTGQVETFPAGYRAGAILYVKEEDLKRAGLGPYKAVAPPAPPPPPAEPAPAAVAAPARPARPAPAPVAAPLAAHAPPLETRGQTARPTLDTAHATGGHPDTGRGPEYGAHAVEHAHPTSAKYVQIAIILAVITAVEVVLYYIPDLSHTLLFWTLIALSAIKFTMVAAYFMHLKFDHGSFTAYFGGGLALAMAIFLGLVALQYATHGAPAGF